MRRSPSGSGQRIVAISDNLDPRHQEVSERLTAHPRSSFQFMPTHASGLDSVEIVFSILYPGKVLEA